MKYLSVFLMLMLLVVGTSAFGQIEPECGTFCQDGSSGSGGPCQMCMQAQYPSTEVYCGNYYNGPGSGYGVHYAGAGRTDCTAHNVGSSHYCGMSGATCNAYEPNYPLSARAVSLPVSWDLRAAVIADFLRKWPGVSAADMLAIYNRVGSATGEAQYRAYYVACAERGIAFTYGGVPVYGERLTKAPNAIVASATP